MKKLLFLFEFPQNIIGFVGYIVFAKLRNCFTYENKDTVVVHVPGWWGAVTFSKYIFADDYFYADTDTIAHEYGHRRQSKRLLLLYLIVIGLPSLIWAGLFEKYRLRTGKSYYSFYTERWANKLGGVNMK